MYICRLFIVDSVSSVSSVSTHPAQLRAAAPLLEPAGLAAVMWSLGTMRQRRPALLETIEAVLPSQLPRLPPRELANTLWGFGKVCTAAVSDT